MKNFVRVLCLLLACLFCLLAVAACNKDDKRKRGSSAVNVRVDDQGVRWAEDEWGVWREYDNLPDEELDYDDEPISFLYWYGDWTVKPEFQQTEEVDNDVLSAIYKRNEAVQDRLGVEFVWTSERGDAGYIGSFISRVQRALDSGTHDFDLIGSYSSAQGTMLTRGLLQNISATEKNYIDTTKPWWPANLSGNLAIKDNLYFVSGDISTNTIYQMHCLFFNKKLLNNDFGDEAEKYFASNPHVKTAAAADKTNPEGGDTASNMLYEKVYAGKWTLDELLAITTNSYKDTKSDGLTADDFFGMCAASYSACAFYGGSNLRMIEGTTDGTILKVSDDWTSTKTLRLAEKLHNLIGTNDTLMRGDTSGGYSTPFLNGKSYLMLYYMRMPEDYLLTSDIDYGVLPIPKFDKDQKNYYTVIGNEFSIYSVFIDFDTRGDEQGTLSMLTAVIECWASEAYRKTTPVIFELNMKLKSSPTQCEADMCEIIRRSIELDLGRILGDVFDFGNVSGLSMDGYVITAAQNGTSWTTVTEEHIEGMKASLADFCSELRKTLV